MKWHYYDKKKLALPDLGMYSAHTGYFVCIYSNSLFPICLNNLACFSSDSQSKLLMC